MDDLKLSISGRLEVGEVLTAWVLGTADSLHWQARVNGQWVNVGTANSQTLVVPSTAAGTSYRLAATTDGQTFYSPETGGVTLDSKKSAAPVLSGPDYVSIGTESPADRSVFNWLSFSDADRSSYAGGSLLLQDSSSLLHGGDGQDMLSVRFAGTLAGQFSYVAATREVKYAFTSGKPVTIGVIDAALNGQGTDLRIVFNGNVTHAVIDALIDNLQFSNADDSPTAERLLTLRITDASGASAQRVTSAQIANEPDDPVITSPGAFQVAENGAAVGTVSAIDPDHEAQQPQGITYSLVSGNGAIDNALFQIDSATGQLRFASAPDFESADHGPAYSVRVRAADSNGGFAEQVIGITVTDVDEAPIASDWLGSTSENAPAILISPVIRDPEGGAFTLSLDLAGTLGVVTQQGDAFLYDQAGRFESLAQGVQTTDRFFYTATDSAGNAVTREVQVVVTGENDLPTISGVAHGSVTEAGASGPGNPSAVGQLAVFDPDLGDSHSWSQATNPMYGFVALSEDGTWRYSLVNGIGGPVDALAEGEILTDWFTVTATDSSGASVSQAVGVTIHGSNDAPNRMMAGDLQQPLVEPGWDGATPVAGDLVAEGPLFTTDPEGDALSWGPPIVYGQYGTFYIDSAAQAYRYEVDASSVDGLPAGARVTERIAFHTTDSHGASTTQHISFIIEGRNDAPIITSGDASATVVEPLPDGALLLDGSVAGGDYAVVQDSQGHLLLTGRSAYGWSQTILRFEEDGMADASFGVNGVAEVQGMSVSALATDAADRVIVAGTGYGGSETNDFSVMRLLSDGSLDASFGAGGLVTIDFMGDHDSANQVIATGDGKLLLAGSVHTSPQGYAQLGLARLDANGMLDMGFGNGGSLVYELGQDVSTADFRVAVDGQGRMLVWGTAIDLDSGERQAVLSRRLADGQVDTDFGEAGQAAFSLGTWYANKAVAVAFEADGGFVMGWNQYADGQTTVKLTRFDADGQVDVGFGTDGTVDTGLLTNYYSDFGLVIDAQGGILVAPQLATTPTGTQDFALARFLADGSVDAAFGNGGRVSTDLGSQERAEQMLLTADGHIIIAGNAMADDFGAEGAALVRYAADGALDLNFGGTGDVQAHGWLSAIDPEGDLFTWTGSGEGTYGALTVDAWGAWVYQLDAEREATQALGEGQTALDTFVVTLTDAHGASATQELVITIVGSTPAML